MNGRLPKELHSSAHQVLFDSTLIGEYEMRIHRGVQGPVIVLEETPHSPLPLEYLSEHAVMHFQEACPNARARFFELHLVNGKDAWVEVYLEGMGCVRRQSSLAVVEAACGIESSGSKTAGSSASL